MYQSQIAVENIAISCYRILNEVKFLRKENKQLKTKIAKMARQMMEIADIEEASTDDYFDDIGELVHDGSFGDTEKGGVD